MNARRDLYREAILNAAEVTFADVGYEATKVADVAKAAGISLMTFYSVFEKKWDVYRAVHARRLDALMHRIGSRRLDKRDVLAALVHSLEDHLYFHMEHPAYLRMHLRERVAWTSTDGLRSQEQTEAWNAGLSMMKKAFRLGIKQGLFVDDDPEMMARTLIGMHQVRLAVWVERGQKEAPSAVVHAAIHQLIRAFCAPSQVPTLTARTMAERPKRRGAKA